MATVTRIRPDRWCGPGRRPRGHGSPRPALGGGSGLRRPLHPRVDAFPTPPRAAI